MTGEAPRILFLHPSDEAYGADRILLALLDGMIERGWTVAVVLPDDMSPGWLTAELQNRGIVIYRGPMAPARRRYLKPRTILSYVRALLRARRFIGAVARRYRPAVIHVNTTALIAASFIRRRRDTRMVWHVHEIVLRPRFLAGAFRLIPLYAADRVVAVSDAVRRWVGWSPFAGARVARIHNGIEWRPAGPPRHPPPRVAYVGRLNRWKGYELFIEAVGLVAGKHPAASFLLIGDAPAGEEWRVGDAAARIAAQGIASRLAPLGFVADPPAIMETVDIVCVPSTQPDPFPTVILESMRAGCAVVASDQGGAPEMIEDGVTGLLVPPGDAPALAAALDRLLGDAELVAKLGARARDHVLHAFGVERFVDEWALLYTELIDG